MMQTPAQRCVRIMAALEDLAEQEAAALANGDYPSLLALQDRTGPLVDFFVASAPAFVSSPDLRPRLAALQRRRQKTSDALALEIETRRRELQQMKFTERRVAQIAPVYGRPAAPRRQLQVVG